MQILINFINLTFLIYSFSKICFMMNSKFYCEFCSRSYSEKQNLKRHQISIHEEKRFDCSICNKMFTRKSKLNNHVCVETSDENLCLNCKKTFFNIYNLKRHLKKCLKSTSIDQCTKSTFIDRDSLEEKIVQQTKEYDDQIEMGKAIVEILNSNSNTKEDALDENQKKSLYLYKSSFTFNIDHIKLRSWQHDLLYHFDNPTSRKIIWVTGENGNEGKSFFQNYIKSIYGTRRVILLDMIKRGENILHILRKQSLICKDIFLFNIAKSFPALDCPYGTLENIKDGQAISPKYDSSILNFKIPNTVMVFSNKSPYTQRLSSDRWIIYRIIKDNLVEDKKFKFQKNSKNESSDESDESDEELNEKSDSSSLNSKNEKFSDSNSYRRVYLTNGKFMDLPIMK